MILPERIFFTFFFFRKNAAASPHWVWALDVALHLPSTVDAMHRRTLLSRRDKTNERNDAESRKTLLKNAGTFQRKARFSFFWEGYKVGKYQPGIIHPSPRKGHLGRGSTFSVANNNGLSKKVSNEISLTNENQVRLSKPLSYLLGSNFTSAESTPKHFF